jgi:hypothetical protein
MSPPQGAVQLSFCIKSIEHRDFIIPLSTYRLIFRHVVSSKSFLQIDTSLSSSLSINQSLLLLNSARGFLEEYHVFAVAPRLIITTELELI